MTGLPPPQVPAVQVSPAVQKSPSLHRVPSPSATASAQYLKMLKDKFGSWRLALAAYNAGEGTYQYWKLPTSRHNHGGLLSFADGHSEYWKWRSSYIASGNAIPDNSSQVPGPGWQAPSSSADQDLPRLQSTFPMIQGF